MTVNKNFVPFAVWQARHGFDCWDEEEAVKWFLETMPPMVRAINEVYEQVYVSAQAAAVAINNFANAFINQLLKGLNNDVQEA